VTSSLKTKAAKGVFWSFFERFSVQGVSFLITIIMARLLSPGDYGLVGMLAIFMSLSQVFIDGGFASALVQKKDRNQNDFSTVFFTNLGISCILYCALYLSSPYIASFYEQPLLESLTKVYSINLIINAFSAVNNTILTINLNFKTQSKISLISSVSSGILGVLSAYIGMGVWAIVVQQLSAALFRAFFSFYFIKWHPSFTFSRKSFDSLFKFGSKLLIASIISNVYANAYNLVIGKKFPAAQLGYFTRATQFMQLVSSNISAILTRVSYPVLSEVQDDNDRLISIYRKYIQLSAFVMFPVVMALCGMAKPLIITLLTSKWDSCIMLIQILSFGYILEGITVININLLSVKGRSDLVLRLEIIKKIIAFTILFISIFFDLIGICIGIVIYDNIALVLNTYYTGKILNYGYVKQIKDVAPYLILSILMAAITLLMGEFIENNYILLIADIMFCIVFYPISTKLFKLYVYQEARDMCKPILSRLFQGKKS